MSCAILVSPRYWHNEFLAEYLHDEKLAISLHFAIATYKQEAQNTEGHGKRNRSNFIQWKQHTVRRFLLHLASCANLVSPRCWHTSFSQTNYCFRNFYCGRISPNVITNKKVSTWWDPGNAIWAKISRLKQQTVTEMSTAKTTRFSVKHNYCSTPNHLWRADAMLPPSCLLNFRLVAFTFPRSMSKIAGPSVASLATNCSREITFNWLL